MRKKLAALAVAAFVLAVAGVAAAYLVVVRDRPEGKLDTVLAGVSVVTPADDTGVVAPTLPETETETQTATTAVEPAEGPCWLEFGGNPQRTLARTGVELGKPAKKPLWARGIGSYMEYPPSFCDGRLYVNTFDGLTLAL